MNSLSRFSDGAPSSLHPSEHAPATPAMAQPSNGSQTLRSPTATSLSLAASPINPDGVSNPCSDDGEQLMEEKGDITQTSFEAKKEVIGREFESLEEVYTFYNNYAKEAGFSVRKDRSAYRKDMDETRIKYFVCSKEGKTRAGNCQKRRRVIDREMCNAKLVAMKKKNSTKWVISKFVDEHNHPCTTPRRVHLLRSHREVSHVKKQLSLQFSEVNIPLSQQISMYAVQAGGLENMGCTQRDLYNYQRDLQREMHGHDVELLLEHFQRKQAKNPAFYFKMEVDIENRLDRCFWIDATSRRSYGIYGDVVVFDTTYNTNRYDMKFAPFVGVNNHGQTIIFAYAFLSNETSESFRWLFDEFNKVMSVGPPKMIITDQDAAISKAIVETFPDTFHRLCIWHIQKKFSEKLDATSETYDYNAFHRCIWESETPDEFESRWPDVLEKTKTTGNTWLSSIFELRSQWVPAYMKHIFSAGMTSSQRVESTHSFFKRYVSKRNSLMEFIVRFNNALSLQRHSELERDHTDIHSQPKLKTPLEMERQMASIYTQEVFYTFQRELWESLVCQIHFIGCSEIQNYYKVVETRGGTLKERTIVTEKETGYTWCSYKMFESEGIPCRHVLTYLRMIAQIENLSDEYILKRWTKAAKSDMVVDESGGEIVACSDNHLLMKKNRLCRKMNRIIECALVSDAAINTLSEYFDIIEEKIISMVRTSKVGSSMVSSISRCEETSQAQLIIHDPLPVKAKEGGKRLKGGKEKAMEKSKRHCRQCGRSGHNKKNCPTRTNQNC